MLNLEEICANAQTIGISGHVRPDGDCFGAVLGLYNYLKKRYPEKEVRAHLLNPNPLFSFLAGFSELVTEPSDVSYDLFFALDLSERSRLGDNAVLFDQAKDTACIDHHLSNAGGTFSRHDDIDPEASSASELVYHVLDKERLDRDAAECLYTGIVHDTGVFRFSCTKRSTMEAAGHLMEYGFDHAAVIRNTYFEKTYRQNLILGRALLESIRILDKRCIVSVIRKRSMEFYGVEPKDLEGIVNQLMDTKGADCAVFMYEIGFQEFRVSLRSNENVDVEKVARAFGGGGHKQAAALTMSGMYYDVINNISEEIEKQFTGKDAV
ncbi:MAG: bifunctional oligoribonuclease/PAP phosphatase NrnA [Lachnospiraceae bacterium]|nr:bifunctional oligoribonuclease/PAP phosphatase NrnA [Lachnospiraceae bacterium]